MTRGTWVLHDWTELGQLTILWGPSICRRPTSAACSAPVLVTVPSPHAYEGSAPVWHACPTISAYPAPGAPAGCNTTALRTGCSVEGRWRQSWTRPSAWAPRGRACGPAACWSPSPSPSPGQRPPPRPLPQPLPPPLPPPSLRLQQRGLPCSSEAPLPLSSSAQMRPLVVQCYRACCARRAGPCPGDRPGAARLGAPLSGVQPGLGGGR